MSHGQDIDHLSGAPAIPGAPKSRSPDIAVRAPARVSVARRDIGWLASCASRLATSLETGLPPDASPAEIWDLKLAQRVAADLAALAKST